MDADADDVTLNLRASTTFQKVYDAVAKARGLNVAALRLTYDGVEVRKTDTPKAVRSLASWISSYQLTPARSLGWRCGCHRRARRILLKKAFSAQDEVRHVSLKIVPAQGLLAGRAASAPRADGRS